MRNLGRAHGGAWPINNPGAVSKPFDRPDKLASASASNLKLRQASARLPYSNTSAILGKAKDKHWSSRAHTVLVPRIIDGCVRHERAMVRAAADGGGACKGIETLN